ncbi:MAG: hypothetical protein CMO55_22005 [Verrucomicrobiales bacterium]|nr:hypothetical protein [Verrucomicrobiales bacterium]
MKIRLERVYYMPKELQFGILYVSEEFDAAAHLCACGCGAKIRTPLGPAFWRFTDTKNGPSLYPSVGNWQLNCQSHYWITDGEIIWAEQWRPEEIAAGLLAQDSRRKAFYDRLSKPQKGQLKKLWYWVKQLFRN